MRACRSHGMPRWPFAVRIARGYVDKRGGFLPGMVNRVVPVAEPTDDLVTSA